MGMIGTIGTLGQAVRLARAAGMTPEMITSALPERTRGIAGRVAPRLIDRLGGARKPDGAALQQALLAALAAEAAAKRPAIYDRAVDGLNRLPRPVMTLGSLGLFGYAFADPAGFGQRMEGLAQMPDQLWWLLGAVVSLFFGAREAHHFRLKKAMEVLFPDDSATENAAIEPKKAGAQNPIAAPSLPSATPVTPGPVAPGRPAAASAEPPALPHSASAADNPALAEWLRLEAARG
jgi:hypothetical protein